MASVDTYTLFLVEMIIHHNHMIEMCKGVVNTTTHPDLMLLCKKTMDKAAADAAEVGALLPNPPFDVFSAAGMRYLYPRPDDYVPPARPPMLAEGASLAEVVEALIEGHRVVEGMCTSLLGKSGGALWTGMCTKKIAEARAEIARLEALRELGNPLYDSVLLAQPPPSALA